jgi:hypothetical protein
LGVVEVAEARNRLSTNCCVDREPGESTTPPKRVGVSTEPNPEDGEGPMHV